MEVEEENKKEEMQEEIKEEVVETTDNFEEAPAYQEVEVKKKEVRTDSYFDGGVLELIGWRILATLITIVTLGIANPWARCMLYSWQIKHTVYNGKRLKFEGTGGDLFVNMFKWLFFTIITLGIYAFFVPVRKAKWVISNIHFEDEELVKDESFFDGKTIQFIGINILSKIITACSFGLLYPFAICLRLRWINRHAVINRKKLVFDGTGFQLWGKYILWYFLTIITLGIFSFFVPIQLLKWEAKHVHIKKVGEEEKKDKSLFIVIPIAIILVIGMIFLLTKVIPNIDSEVFNDITYKVSESLNLNRRYEDQSAGGIYERLKEAYLSGRISAKTFMTKVENDSIYVAETFMEDEDTEFKEKLKSELGVSEVIIPEKSSGSGNEKATPIQIDDPVKTSITVGGYTLNFGTYKGTMVQGVWDEETMTSTARYYDVILKLTENTITLDGQTAGYSVSGNKLKWKAMDFDVLEVTGNNTITYMAESCPDLVWQGY